MKIEFRFTNQYQHFLAQELLPEDFFTWKVQTEDHWHASGPKILNALEDVTGLHFTAKPLVCYVNSMFSLSDPLTLRLTSNIDENIDNLTHELIHVLFTQNYKGKFKKKWDNMMKDYSSESMLTKSHIPVHAVHYKLANELFPKRLNAIVLYAKHPDYIKAWEIVKAIGHDNILEKYVYNKNILNIGKSSM